MERIDESLEGEAEQQQLKNMARMMAAKEPRQSLARGRVRVAGHVCFDSGSETRWGRSSHERVVKKGPLIRELS